MPSLDERVAYLEGKVEEHSRGFGELRHMVFQLDQKIDRFREELAGRIDSLDRKMSTQFLWTLGVQIAVLLAVVGALVGA